MNYVSTPDQKGSSTNEPAGLDSQAPVDLVPFRKFFLYFLKLGATGFGGPIALAGYMQRDLVEKTRWVSKQDYKEGLALAQLMPGPLAAQLAIYLGWVKAGIFGATLISIAFVLPSFLMVLLISFLYVKFDGIPWMQGAFYGIGAAVIAIIARSAYKLVKTTIGKDRLLWAVLIVSALTTAITEREILWIFLASGILVMAVKSRNVQKPGISNAAIFLPAGLFAGSATPASFGILGQLFYFFFTAGAVVFGSGLAIVPFLYGGVVEQFHWLNERQFLDAVAVAMITPGPVVITVAFIGFLVAGPAGATVAALGVFLPCYLLVIFPAPYFRRISANHQIRYFVDGVTASASGAIAGAAFVLGKRAITDIYTAAIGLMTLAALVYLKKLPEPLIIIAAGMVGILITSARL